MSSPPIGAASGRSPGSSSTATPTKPSATHSGVARPTRSPNARRKSTTHSGTEAMTSAARPDGTPWSSPTDTSPLPPSSSATPTNEQPSSSARVTRSADHPRRTTSHVAKSRPARKNRAPPESRAGIVSTT